MFANSLTRLLRFFPPSWIHSKLPCKTCCLTLIPKWRQWILACPVSLGQVSAKSSVPSRSPDFCVTSKDFNMSNFNKMLRGNIEKFGILLVQGSQCHPVFTALCWEALPCEMPELEQFLGVWSQRFGHLQCRWFSVDILERGPARFG